MTLPSRLLIKASLVYLVVGALFGSLMLVNKAINFGPVVWMLLPVHIELMIFGWIIQFTLGVAYWILPRFLEGEVRGNNVWAYLMVLCFNLGVGVIIFGELTEANNSVLVLGRGFELLAVVLFVSLHWKRIVTYNKNGH